MVGKSPNEIGPARNKIPIAAMAETNPIERATNRRLLDMNSATMTTVIPSISQGVVGIIA